MQKSQAQPRPQVMKLDELALRGFAESKARAGEFAGFCAAHLARAYTGIAASGLGPDEQSRRACHVAGGEDRAVSSAA
jgi:hypothetical protein